MAAPWSNDVNPGWHMPQLDLGAGGSNGFNPNWQSSPQTLQTAQQDALRYGQSHPQWQGYQQIMQGSTPSQIMAGQASGVQLPGQDASSGMTGLQGLWSMLQGSNAPQDQAIDALKQQLGLDVGNEAKLTSLKQGDLRASTGIEMARANKMIQGAQDVIQNVGQQRGFVDQLYNQSNKQAGLEYGQNRANLLSDATARGAVNSHGTVSTFQNQYNQFANQLAGNTTQKNKSLADLNLQEKQAQNVAQQYGMDKTELQQKLSNGLQQLGISGQIDLGNLFQQASSLDAQKAGVAQGMITQLIQYAQGNPNLMNQLPGFMSGGAGFSSGGQGNSFASGGHGVR